MKTKTTKTNSTTTATRRRSSGHRNPLVTSISDLLRALSQTLGIAYVDTHTPPAVIEHLESAKQALLTARCGATSA